MPTADEMLSSDAVKQLSECLRDTGSRAEAVDSASVALSGKTFSERVALVRDAILVDLPADFLRFKTAIETALTDPAFNGWMIMPVTEAVAARGLQEFEPALKLLAQLTPRLTAETAIRHFLNADLNRALDVIVPWTENNDPHVRRLASEGTRPRLPWAARIPALMADPSPALPILDALYRDSSEYVRRSVANHLNDISKDHPQVAVKTAARWLAEPDGNTLKTVRHGLRSRIKAGDLGALALLGYSSDVEIDVSGPVVDEDVIHLGEALKFSFAITNRGKSDAPIAVDYIIHHVKANGSRSPKVFKLSSRTVAPGDTWSVRRRHPIRPISTRRYYPGAHLLELQVNGISRGSQEFTLVMRDDSGPV
ncbi:DNA alkylation repair protein [Hoyosella subflava]|uniref:Putative DNA alkylation repair protein n=1 Tax=Hoyosella subflava (strain DSM 45089 / JCM 17490 / NBRC 109087 / DQS3-9A1) TaxID=443218 RepID=F6ENR9_HOYSD|nr:DNA alkylation repair protein [Hoyosella subflava]AEF42926.1 Putative DNA alkylation repair protein [Hoyosella subflava DQS3-9A1]